MGSLRLLGIWNDLKECTSDCPYCEVDWAVHGTGGSDDCPYKAMDYQLAQSAPVGRELCERNALTVEQVRSVYLRYKNESFVNFPSITKELNALAGPDTLRERLEGLRDEMLNEQVMKSSDAGDCIAAERAEEWAEAINKLLASAPTPAVTTSVASDLSSDTNREFIRDSYSKGTDAIPTGYRTTRPAPPVEARAADTANTMQDWLSDNAAMDDEERQAFQEMAEDLISRALQAAEQAGMEQAAQIAELYLSKSNIPPLTIEWQIMIREIRARALAHSTTIKGATDVPSKT